MFECNFIVVFTSAVLSFVNIKNELIDGIKYILCFRCENLVCSLFLGYAYEYLMQVLFASEYYLTSALGVYLTCKVWDGATIGLKVKFHLQKNKGTLTQIQVCWNCDLNGKRRRIKLGGKNMYVKRGK